MNTDGPAIPTAPDSVQEPAKVAVAPPYSQSYLYLGFWPMVVILVTLIFSTVRDIVAMNEQIVAIDRQNEPGRDLLKRSAKQTAFVERIHSDLQGLSATNPTAAQLLREYFNPPQPASAAARESVGPTTNNASSSPAK